MERLDRLEKSRKARPSVARGRQRIRIEQNDYREPNKFLQKLRAVNWCRVVLFVAAVYAVFSIAVQVVTIVSQKNKQSALINEQQELEQQVEQLEQQEEYVGTEEYIEQSAREKFGWVKEDEIVFKKKDTAE